MLSILNESNLNCEDNDDSYLQSRLSCSLCLFETIANMSIIFIIFSVLRHNHNQQSGNVTFSHWEANHRSS